MTAPWIDLAGSEKLHLVRSRGWREDIVSRAVRLVPTPVPYVGEVAGASSAGAPSETRGLEELMGPEWADLHSELPADLVEMLFGKVAS
jgi:hypothetical protein